MVVVIDIQNGHMFGGERAVEYARQTGRKLLELTDAQWAVLKRLDAAERVHHLPPVAAPPPEPPARTPAQLAYDAIEEARRVQAQ